jgi:hypothetical protein
MIELLMRDYALHRFPDRHRMSDLRMRMSTEIKTINNLVWEFTGILKGVRPFKGAHLLLPQREGLRTFDAVYGILVDVAPL